MVLISSVVLYQQIYSLDVKNFSSSDDAIRSSSEDTGLYNLEITNANVSLPSLLLKKTHSFANIISLETDESETTLRRKSSLLSVVYDSKPIVNENFGTITIYKLNRVLPIIQGSEEKQLGQGAGHVLSSVLPGENDNFVLAGHRETSFRGLDQLIIGDLILIQTDLGEFTYEVDRTRIVEDDSTNVIVSTEYASLTLVTCYPFNWVGNAPQRYIVTAVLIRSNIS